MNIRRDRELIALESMAEEGTDTKPLGESSAEVKSEEAPVQDSSSHVEITEESAPATSEGVNKASTEEQQPKPIVEEPNANTIPQLHVIPEGNSTSENTVITEITTNETQEVAPTNKPEQNSEPSEPKKDMLDAAMESAKTMPAPIKKPTIIREPGAPDLPPAANTIFILDLMKQKQEKLRRKKKDDMILEMALKMKKEKEEAKRKGKASSYSYNSGGFLGVHHLTSNKSTAGKSPQLHRKVRIKLVITLKY